ncbi:unnamed protein product [Lactuca virosa]|uniref:Uncharacterized protein n=1 Tax=Lactuca virosa TaxID=75947 RepID=A0AAU9LT41_9ASTR|nr:unnamed protein product [Lactuca virosa]
MLRSIDPANPILVQYLTTVNPNVQVGVLLPNGAEGTWKVVKASKKSKKTEQTKFVPEQVENEVTEAIHENAEKEVSKEVVPSKTSILKRTKKPAHRPRHSLERTIIEEVPVEPLSSPKEVSISKGIRKIHKPQPKRRGAHIRDVPVPISLASKKRKAYEVVKKIKKKS